MDGKGTNGWYTMFIRFFNIVADKYLGLVLTSFKEKKLWPNKFHMVTLFFEEREREKDWGLSKFTFIEEKQGDVRVPVLLSNEIPYLEQWDHLDVTENFFQVSVYIHESTQGQEDPKGHPYTP